MIWRLMIFLIIGLILILGLLAGPALADPRCAEREVVVRRLAAEYGEAFDGGGLQNPTAIIEVWSSAERGTWTVLLTRADGVSCIMASGSHWRKGDPRPAGMAG